MSIKTEVLFNNTWNVRISDPGEEGAQSHFFETIYLTLILKAKMYVMNLCVK